MGFRFHKQIRLGSFLRINVSKGGLSLGVGHQGVNVNLSSQGMKTSVGLPGSGLSHKRQHNWETVKEQGANLGITKGQKLAQYIGIATYVAIGLILVATLVVFSLLSR